MIDFGIRLRRLRTDKGLTQAQLAERLGLTKSVISAYETDTRLQICKAETNRTTNTGGGSSKGYFTYIYQD